MVDPASSLYYRWLCLISIVVLYNVLMIIGRAVFWELQNLSPAAWYAIDYAFDALYVVDMAVSARTGKLSCFQM